MITSIFWNTSHERPYERAGDPLGFDALREAMSDCLVPHLTGGTKYTDDYLWVLVGLRWARGGSVARVDADVWEEFRKFERALKQYWQKFTKRRDYMGKRAVKKLCEYDRPNVNQRILTDERTTGLLGTYITSLRAIGLVEKSLAPTKVGDQLIRGVGFMAHPRTFTSWSALRDGYATTEREVRGCRKALGNHLFRDDHMRCAASAMLKCPSALSWSGLTAHLSTAQRRVATACAAVLNVEEAMVSAFSELMTGRPSLTAAQRAQVQDASARVRDRHPIPDAWSNQPIAKALDGAWSACIDGRRIEQKLINLHVEVVHSVRGNEPWITVPGKESLIKFRPAFTGRDFRLRNLRRLVNETKWNSDAVRA